jgi:hypothetical protein
VTAYPALPPPPPLPILGKEIPRIFTPPLRELTPQTSLGFACNFWIKHVLKFELMPHQIWLNIHLLELLPDGSRRFEEALILQGRQSGKTTWCASFLLWRLHADNSPAALCAAQDRSIALEMLERAQQMVLKSDHPDMIAIIPTTGHQANNLGLNTANGKERLVMGGTKVEVSAGGRNAGRGKSPQTLVIDEIRSMEDAVADGLASLEPVTSAQTNPLNIYLSNAGTDRSLVLNEMEDTIRAKIAQGIDPEVFYASWSAPDNSEITDREAWSQALPTLNRITPENRIAKKMDKPNVFKSEYMNMRVSALTPSLIPLAVWESLGDDITLEQHAEKLCLFVDVSPTLDHAIAVLSADLDGTRNRIQLGGEWPDTASLVEALPALIAALKPVAMGYFGDGPTLALATELDALGFEMIKSSSASCGGLVEAVSAHRVLHLKDALLASHIENVQKLPASDGFRFSRKHSTGAINGAYAAAGALHLSRNLPAKKTRRKPRFILPSGV